ncbi:MAG: exodeoxyribonuclease VII large subunit [Clostridia bacterium]|nr:exodeoxyribonuclease VII large subunit [Clostridia bacterium]
MQQQVLSVGQLNEYLKMLMDSNQLLSDVLIRGEISNFTNHYKTGHFYFSLKDENALIRAVMFRSYAQRVEFMPENGMKVIVHGRVSVFPRDGQYQIYVDELLPDGVGALYLAYEQLRRKLEAEGLFDPVRKRPLPPYPQRIGIITSPTGAAVRDMIQILGRRFPVARVILYPALVQGTGAPESLVRGLHAFAAAIPVDLIIIGRGGGSAEDLWAFNNELLARAVAASPVPVISAVGHETDVTICDFVADLRAPTPSAAAELAVPDVAELKGLLSGIEERMSAAFSTLLTTARSRVAMLSNAGVLRSPRRYLEDRAMAVAFLEKRLEHATATATERARTDFGALAAKLGALNPLHVLSRGYAAAFDDNGSPVTRAEGLSAGQNLHIRFADRTADTVITGVRESE